MFDSNPLPFISAEFYDLDIQGVTKMQVATATSEVFSIHHDEQNMLI